MLLRALLTRLAGAFSRDRGEQDLREEMEAHLEMEVERLMHRGLTRDEARREALILAGGLTQAAEAVRDQRRLPLIEDIASDLRYAFRSLRRVPAFTIVVVLTLGLGVGANSAIFSVVRGVLLKPLPHRDGDRLVYLRQSASGPGQSDLTFSVVEVRDLRAGVPAFAGIAEYSTSTMIRQTEDGPVRIRVGLVSGNYFDVMGLSPLAGRVTNTGDDGPAAARVAVLTYGYWMRRFAGDSSIIGKQIVLDRRPVTVIGILQPAPSFPEVVDVMLNLVNSDHHVSATMQHDRTHRMTLVVGRLANGASLDRARTEVASLYARLQQEYREAYPAGGQYRITLIPFKSVLGERARLTLLLLMISAAFVLLVSAANVANLTMMRGVRRRQEYAVRAALGAGTARLRRLLLAENLTLTLAGAMVGSGIAAGGVPLLTAFAALFTTRTEDIHLDGAVFFFTIAVSLGIAVALSLATRLPREGRFASQVMAGARRTSAGRRGQRVQRSLVVLQVAVTVMLLAGAGLLTRAMMQLANVDTGLATEDVLSMRVALLSFAEMRDSTAVVGASERFKQMRQALAEMPGVSAVGVGDAPPLQSNGVYNLVQAQGAPMPAGVAMPRVNFRGADADFFQASGIPLLSGRTFQRSGETADAVIVNRAVAERFFPRQDAVGRRIFWKLDWRADTLRGLTIVGVVGNTRDGSLDAEPRMVAFMPMGRVMPPISGAFVIRAQHAEGLAAAATKIVRGFAPSAVIEDVMTIAQYKSKNVSPRRLSAALVSAFGILAMLIAAVGIAGVLAFSVSARTNEIGIRMSLGADGARVQRMIIGEGATLVGGGLLLGAVGAFFVTTVMRGLLFGIAPHDPLTFAAVAAIMGTIGLVASWIPALRASRIDPAISMRA